MTLFKIWEENHEAKTLPEEWRTWGAFRQWATTNKYKAEYGYKGEFTSESLMKTLPEESVNKNSEIPQTPEKLIRLKLDELKAIAEERQIDLGEAITKKEIINIIIERRQGRCK